MISAVTVAAGAVAMSLFPNFWLVVAAQTVIGGADAVFPAAIGAISLGIVGPGLFTRRVGRNEAFNHAGNAALVSIQVLDGIGAGIFGALFFIVIADLTSGTGRYNLTQGAASATWGLGAAFSNSVAGLIVDKAGFSAAFLFLACCALGAFLLLWVAMPETVERNPDNPRELTPMARPTTEEKAPAG